MPKCWFDYNNCATGIDALRTYRRQYHEHTQSFSDKPLHDWASNSADGFRYLALVADKSIAMPTEKAPMTRLPDGSRVGLPRAPGQGYTLDDLWAARDDETGKQRYEILRI